MSFSQGRSLVRTGQWYSSAGPLPMRHSLSLPWHLLLLLGFCVVAFFLWMLPVLLAGFPYIFPDFADQVQVLAETGFVPAGSSRFGIVLVWALHTFIPFENVTCWVAVGAAFLAASLVPLWWAVRRLFDTRTAWVTVILFALMPLYWTEALQLRGYTFAFPFLFLGFACFVEFFPHKRLLALGLFAVCFGLTLASRDAFIALLPWFAVSYVWLHRKHWKRAVLEVALVCGIAYAAFVSPLIINAVHTEGALTQKISVFLPSLNRTMPDLGHLYPDDYTYEYEREAFEQHLRDQLQDESFIERQQGSKTLHLFGIVQYSGLQTLWNSFWLFLNNIPTLFAQDTVGGPFLWLFILPGMAALWSTRRTFFLLITGLWVSMEVVLRFGLHFGRDHLMDIGFLVPLLAAIGLLSLLGMLHQHWKRVSLTTLTVLTLVLVAVQLVQTNRKQFARLYAHSEVPEAYEATAVLNSIPADAVVAHPRKFHLFRFAEHPNVNINKETVDWLSDEGRLRKPFTLNKVRYILGYDADRVRKIQAAVPGIQVLTLPQTGVPLTSWTRFVLNLVR